MKKRKNVNYYRIEKIVPTHYSKCKIKDSESEEIQVFTLFYRYAKNIQLTPGEYIKKNRTIYH